MGGGGGEGTRRLGFYPYGCYMLAYEDRIRWRSRTGGVWGNGRSEEYS